MSKVIVRGGAPGMMRVEVEGTDLGVDISTSLPAYTAVQELAGFMSLLLQSVPEAPVKHTSSVVPKAGK
jgi:hypothetical protein